MPANRAQWASPGGLRPPDGPLAEAREGILRLSQRDLAIELRRGTRGAKMGKSRAEALETLGKADCGSLPIGIGQDKVRDHVIKRLASQRDVQVVHGREVGGSQLAGPMDLIEKDLLGWTLGGSPRFDLPLSGAKLDVGKSAWEATLKILEESFGLEPGIEFQQVTKLGPNVLERILPGPPGSRGHRFTRHAISMPVLSS